jgi:hypothetical protein
MRFAQLAGAWLARGMTLLMLVAVVLAAARLLVQVFCAALQMRRVCRSSRGPLDYLGPVSVIAPAHNEAANIAATVRSLVGNDYRGWR